MEKKYDATDYAIYMFKYKLLLETMNKCGIAIPAQLINQIIPCPDLLLPSKIAIHKSLEWKHEKEWRLFCTNSNPSFINEAHSFVQKRPVAIYLGRKISDINEKILKDFAKERGIDCFKMEINSSSRGNSLMAIRQEL